VPVRLKLRNLTQVDRVNENEPGHKSEKYFLQTRDGKLLLRKVMERYIPAEIADGIKKGFTPPGGSWFKGDSIDYVRRTILDPKAAVYEVLDYEAVKELVEEHLSGVNNRRLLIWSLLSFEWFSRRYLGGREG